MRLRIPFIILLVLTAAGGGWFLYSRCDTRELIAPLRFLAGNKAIPAGVADSTALLRNIRLRLNELEVPDSLITVRRLSQDALQEVRSILPLGRPTEWIVWHLSGVTKGTVWKIADADISSNGNRCTIRFVHSSNHRETIVLSLRRSSRFISGSARMAIFISDFNFSTERLTSDILAFPHPLTLGILASRPLSAPTAHLSDEYRKEVVILLPMEGALPAVVDRSIPRIMVHYPDERIRTIIGNATATLPSFSGFSNLGGARVLSDSRSAGIVFSELKKRRGYFIERPVTAKSLVISEAGRFGVSAAAIDFVMDSTLSKNAMKEALLRYGAEARKRGKCIVSCRPSSRILPAIEAALPGLQEYGVSLSFVSDVFSRSDAVRKQ